MTDDERIAELKFKAKTLHRFADIALTALCAISANEDADTNECRGIVNCAILQLNALEREVRELAQEPPR